MKLRVNFKDPDLIDDYLYDQIPGDTAKAEQARDKLSKKLFLYGDYGTIELDTETGMGKLVPYEG